MDLDALRDLLIDRIALLHVWRETLAHGSSPHVCRAEVAADIAYYSIAADLASGSDTDRRGDIDQYRHLTACFTCPLKPKCTPDKLKRIKRWKHERVLDAMQARLDRMPDAMGVRRQTVEHPFGTIKAWMGSTHFLTRTLKRVSTEMSLHVLAYNIKRVIAIIGVGPLLQAIRV